MNGIKINQVILGNNSTTTCVPLTGTMYVLGRVFRFSSRQSAGNSIRVESSTNGLTSHPEIFCTLGLWCEWNCGAMLSDSLVYNIMKLFILFYLPCLTLMRIWVRTCISNINGWHCRPGMHAHVVWFRSPPRMLVAHTSIQHRSA